VKGVALHDGSGLAPDNRVTCASLLGAIDLGAQPRFSAIIKGLAVAGESGTLLGRFTGTVRIDPLFRRQPPRETSSISTTAGS